MPSPSLCWPLRVKEQFPREALDRLPTHSKAHLQYASLFGFLVCTQVLVIEEDPTVQVMYAQPELTLDAGGHSQ